MKRRSFYVFLAASLAMLIPTPGRFAYGLILVVELLLITFFGTIFSVLNKKLKLNEAGNMITMLMVIAISVFYKQMVILICPEAALTLGFVFYLIPVSIFFAGYLYSNTEGTLNQRLRVNMVHMITFCIYALIFFTIRDVFGFGTFTYIGTNHQLVEKIIFSENTIGFMSILASIPGALVLSSIFLMIHIILRNKFNIIRNSEAAE